MARRYGGYTTWEEYKAMLKMTFWFIVAWIGLAYFLAYIFPWPT